MRSWIKPVLLGAGIMLLGVSPLAGGGDVAHLADSKCQECHLSARVEPDKARLLVASQEKLCAGCHPKAIQMSHPSGFVPRRPLPAGFPLDWKGELTCASCHHIHGKQPGLPRVAATGADLCRACHDDSFFIALSEQGKRKPFAVHEERAPPPVAVVVLDALSRHCMECHDDKGGTAQERVSLNAKGVVRHMSNALSHPLGGLYVILSQFGGYRPVGSLPETVLLQDGKVGCLSCHEKYRAQEHGGVIVTRYESVCHACHVQ
ncbi:MAG: cytochrome c3 family protein [Magnetococcales bacterium]|nr:cytochrome c3 family protein [Magnetococcales bacterium]